MRFQRDRVYPTQFVAQILILEQNFVGVKIMKRRSFMAQTGGFLPVVSYPRGQNQLPNFCLFMKLKRIWTLIWRTELKRNCSRHRKSKDYVAQYSVLICLMRISICPDIQRLTRVA